MYMSYTGHLQDYFEVKRLEREVGLADFSKVSLEPSGVLVL